MAKKEKDDRERPLSPSEEEEKGTAKFSYEEFEAYRKEWERKRQSFSTEEVTGVFHRPPAWERPPDEDPEIVNTEEVTGVFERPSPPERKRAHLPTPPRPKRNESSRRTRSSPSRASRGSSAQSHWSEQLDLSTGKASVGTGGWRDDQRAKAIAEDSTARLEVSDEFTAAFRPHERNESPFGILILVENDHYAKEFQLDDVVNRVGRLPNCHVQLEHPSVSRNHGEIIRQGKKYLVVDRGSPNKIRVNGRIVESEAVLRQGDEVRFGEVRLLFVAPGGEIPPEAEWIAEKGNDRGWNLQKFIVPSMSVLLVASVLLLLIGKPMGDPDDLAARIAAKETPLEEISIYREIGDRYPVSARYRIVPGKGGFVGTARYQAAGFTSGPSEETLVIPSNQVDPLLSGLQSVSSAFWSRKWASVREKWNEWKGWFSRKEENAWSRETQIPRFHKLSGFLKFADGDEISFQLLFPRLFPLDDFDDQIWQLRWGRESFLVHSPQFGKFLTTLLTMLERPADRRIVEFQASENSRGRGVTEKATGLIKRNIQDAKRRLFGK
ncbi:MAG: FHA domain-containing protein [Deltaproteobacteria bacterium]|nr:MAG: FHA domain-containing protein [Deltaproteobacteria bacterium]